MRPSPQTTNVELRLTEAAELVANALVFWHLTLAATILAVAGSGVHTSNVVLLGTGGNVPLVTHQMLGRTPSGA